GIDAGQRLRPHRHHGQRAHGGNDRGSANAHASNPVCARTTGFRCCMMPPVAELRVMNGHARGPRLAVPDPRPAPEKHRAAPVQRQWREWLTGLRTGVATAWADPRSDECGPEGLAT